MTTDSFTLIAGDGSDRKFYRWVGNAHQTSICMQFSAWEGGYGGDPNSWLEMQKALVQMGIPVPEVLKVDKDKLCIWTEDLGDVFLGALPFSVKMYEEALNLLVRAQYPSAQIQTPASSRLFDFEKLYYEMNFFVKYFLNEFLNLNVGDKTHAPLFEDIQLLCEEIQKFQRVFCHRDYHSRNLMVKDKRLYWIDFQDARMGPHSYDVVSLLRDSYVQMDWDTRKSLCEYYLKCVNALRHKGHLPIISEDNFHRELLLVGLQRNVKAIGSFAYLACEKKKPSYLAHVFYTLGIVCSPQAQVCAQTNLKTMFPEFFELLERLYRGDLSALLRKQIERAQNDEHK